MESIAVFRHTTPLGSGRRLLGFVERKLKTFTSLAPSYSRRGPYEERTFTYVVLGKQKWPINSGVNGFFKTLGEKNISVNSVLLRYHDSAPDDLRPRDDIVQSFE